MSKHAGTCDNCGVNGSLRTIHRGVQPWEVCPRCYAVMWEWVETGVTPEHPFGLPLSQLKRPLTGRAGWVSYRLACCEVGHTLFTAPDRPTRDAIHDAWGRWGAYIMGVRIAEGRVRDKPRQNFYARDFLRHVRDVYGVATPGRDVRALVLEHLQDPPLRGEADPRILRARQEALLNVPPRKGLLT